ncbi:hypothetical protein [Morganella morganii]|uniref:hypothetical protein n=1 Tax=Morganella morganii TaxID=582 RepID=UPI00331C539A
MRLLLNSILLVFSMTAAAACLWGVSHLAWYYALPALIGFMLINNMPFAILHEAVHGVAARTAAGNRAIGIIAAWAFPTSFTLQRRAI